MEDGDWESGTWKPGTDGWFQWLIGGKDAV